MKNMMILEMLFLIGMVILVVDISPYFGALGLIIVSLVGCLIILVKGNSFLSLSLLLIYLGGMMVVFSYCTALVLDLYPTVIVKEVLMKMALGVLVVVFLGSSGYLKADNGILNMLGEGGVDNGFLGAGVLYGESWLLIVFGGLGLFLALLVILEIIKSAERGAYRII
uniref:NADH dehydrogenase subunit 6 n=1 Tax=Myxine fernholmi TaxID=1932030 RepID=UPI001EDEF743|nr:NADH dehydrogenase subunit 6 [Myxine fernholmi]UKB88186.1 NADH dehydrogenase subunit 6 [Myxine fernholmi]